MDWRYCFLLIALIAAQSGCRSLIPNASVSAIEKITANVKGPKDSDHDSTPTGLQTASDLTTDPSRIAVIWKEDVLQSGAARPVKGFTGRIYFYNGSNEIVPVDGQLNVYGYDDSDLVKQRVPNIHFIIEADKFADHYSPSNLGPSYTIWIPWEEYGGHRKSITLIPVFKTRSNKIIQGNADYVTLSGKVRQADALQRTIIDSSNRNTNQQRGNPANFQQQKLNNTIPVPESISDQWRLENELKQYSRRRNLVPVNPTTMNILDQAQQQPNGSGYNQVALTNDKSRSQVIPSTQHGPAAPYAQRIPSTIPEGFEPLSNISAPVNRGAPIQQQNHTYSTGGRNASTPGFARQQQPSNTRQPPSNIKQTPNNNGFRSQPGIHTALTDIPPEGYQQQAPQQQRAQTQPAQPAVFGRPGAIR